MDAEYKLTADQYHRCTDANLTVSAVCRYGAPLDPEKPTRVVIDLKTGDVTLSQ